MTTPAAPAGYSSTPTPPAGYSGGDGGALSYDDLQQLWVKAGGDPRYARIMARVALNESGGRPNNVNTAGYVGEGGKTYHPAGLWQISDVHPGGPWLDPLKNAKKAVELFNSNPNFNDPRFAWADSRNKGAYGGWGQDINSDLMPYVEQGRAQAQHSLGIAPELLYHRGGEASFDASHVDVAHAQFAGLNIPPPPGGYGSPPPPPSGYSSPQQNPAQRVAGAASNLVAGKPVGKGSPLARKEAELRSNWDWVAHHPVDALFNVLSTPNRIVMAGMTTADQTQGDIPKTLQSMGHALFDADAHEMSKLTAGTEHLLHLPTHEAVTKWIDRYVPKDMRGMVGAVVLGGEDFAAQAITDPLTYSGFGDIAKGAEFLKILNPLFAGGRVAHYAWEAAKAVGLEKEFSHLGALRTMYDKTLGQVGNTAHKLLSVRPDLDVVLTESGKKARIQIENRVLAEQGAAQQADEAALRAGDDAARKRFLSYHATHGSARNARTAGDLGGTATRTRATGSLRSGNIKGDLGEFMEQDAAGRAATLNTMRQSISKAEIKRLSEEYFNKYSDGLQKGKGLNDLGSLRTSDQASDTFKKFVDEHIPILKVLRDYMRSTIMWNPLPHALKNVGMLATLAGGAGIIPRAMKYAVTGLTDEQRARLVRIGAAPVYQHGIEESFPRDLFLPQTNAMTRIEEGWRQALLDQLDKKMPTRSGTLAQDELMKGYMVADRLGDYRNQSAFVKVLTAVGGPFVAFRLGIVPRNVMRAIKERPDRVLAYARAQVDLNANRQGKGNELQFGGPVTDLAEFAANPAHYILTSAGAIGREADASSQSESQKPSFGQRVVRGVEQYVPGASAFEDASKIITGTAMPDPTNKGPRYQHMSLADKLAVSFLMTLGMYFSKEQSRKTLQSEKKREASEGL